MRENINKDAFIVTSSILISKLLGIVFVFPFSRIVGIEALSLYSYAYVPLTLFLDLSTLGIPHGMSKFVSKYYTNQKEEVIHYQFKYTKIALLLISLVFFAVLYFVAPLYARTSLGGKSLTNSIEDVTTAIRIVGVLILIVPILSLHRGYFYGKKIFVISGLSQIIEQFIRVIFILVSAYMIVNLFALDYKIAIYYALFGAVIAGVVTLLFIMVSKNIVNRKVCLDKGFKYNKKYFAELINYSYPFIVTGICFTMLSVLDSITFNKGLIEYGIENPETYYGIYSFQVQKLVFIPVSISLGYSASLLSRITEYKEEGDNAKISSVITNSYSNTINMIIPIIVITIINSDVIYNILYTKNDIGPEVLKFYIFQTITISLYNITNSSLQALNKGKIMIPIMLFMLVIKYLLNVTLLKNIGYLGAIVSTFISLGIVIFGGFILLHKNKCIDIKRLYKQVHKMLLVSVISFGILQYTRYLFNISNIVTFFITIFIAVLGLFLYIKSTTKVT